MFDALTAYNGLLLRAGLYVAVFGPPVGYYVYTDSKERGLPRPKLRGVAYGVFGALGLVVYMVRKARSNDGERNR
ncbi:MAG: hypothetical protein ACLFR5_00325 [Halobacteriales archaeon]